MNKKTDSFKNIITVLLELLILVIAVGPASAAADITIANARITSSNTVVVTFDEHNEDLDFIDQTKWHIDLGDGGATPLNSTGVALTKVTSPGNITLTFAGTPFSATNKTYNASWGLFVEASGVVDTGGDTNTIVGHAASIAIADGQKPTFTAARTDLNTIVLTFSETVDAADTATAAWTVEGATVSSVTDPASSTTLTITTTGLTSTNLTPAVAYVAASGTVKDVSVAKNEVADRATANAADQVSPTFTAARTDVNTIVLTLSEPVTGSAIANSFTVAGASSVTNTAPTASTTVTLTTVGLTATDGTPEVNYVAATGDIVDDSAAHNEVADGGAVLAADQVPPTVLYVNSSEENGSYTTGQVINISVNYSEPVDVADGVPNLTLNSGGVALYAGGTGTDSLTFRYVVGTGQNSADLDYNAATSLDVNGSTIRDAALNDAVNILAKPGAANSLGANKNIVIDTTGPAIIAFAPTSPVNDITGAIRTFNITANQTVNVTWYFNGTSVLTNTSVIDATYTNTSAVAGFWNVTAIANNINGTDSKKWDWNVTATPTPTPTPKPTETPTPTDTPTPTATPMPTNGIIAGNVTNASGASIAGATVTADSVTATTDSKGSYSISIASGIYNVTASATGFLSNSANITVTSGATAIQDFTLTSTGAPVLRVIASPTSATAGTATNVIFTVTGNSSAVSGATVNLSGAATGSNTTNASGIAIISVNATAAGSIIATASKNGYKIGTTTIIAGSATGTPALVSSILPNSRNEQLGTTVTLFMSVINHGTGTATGVSIIQASSLPATVTYQQWDGTSLIGSANEPVDMAAGATADFVLTINATSAFDSSVMTFDVSSTNGATASISGVNTLTISSNATPSADIIMISTNVNVSSPVNKPTAFALATMNIGGASATGVRLVPGVPSSITGLAYQVNQTNSTTGAIIGPAAGLTIAVGATPTFAVFLTPTKAITFDPTNNRITLKLVDGNGKVIGAQSVAVSTT